MTDRVENNKKSAYTQAPEHKTPLVVLVQEAAVPDAVGDAVAGLDKARFRITEEPTQGSNVPATGAVPGAVIVSVETDGGDEHIAAACERYPDAAVLVVGPESTALAISALALGAQEYIAHNSLSSQRLESTILIGVARKKQLVNMSNRERHYRMLVEEASDGIVIMNGAGQTQEVNRRVTEMLGYSRDELMALRISDLIVPDELEAAPLRTHEALSGKTLLRERTLIRKDGSLLPTENTTRLLPDGHFQITVRDITERKEMERYAARLGTRSELILTSSGEGIYGVDRQGLVTFINPAAAGMLGWAKEDLVGKHIHSLCHHTKADGSHFPAVDCPIYEAIRDGTVHHVSDDIFWRKDGTPIYVEYHSNPLREGRELVGAVVAFTDVTGRRETEAQIRKLNEELEARVEMRTAQLLEANRLLEAEAAERKRSRDQLEAILRGVADGITAQDASGKLIYANDAALRALQFPSDVDVVSIPPGELMQRFDILDEAGNLFPVEKLPGRRAMEGREGTETLVGWRYRATGKVRWSVVKATPILNEQGRTGMVINIFRDITESRLIEQQIRDSEQKFRAVFDSAFDAIFVLDDTGRIADCNNAACGLTGLTREELLNTPFGHFLAQDGHLTDEDAWSIFLEAGDLPRESVITLPDGTHRSIEYQSKAYILPGFHLSVWHDITTRKDAERELWQANNSLKDAFKELEAFSYSVSHDLQAPLRAISGYSYALLEDYNDKLDANAQNFLNRIIANTGKMDRLINDLLTFSRVSRQQKAEHPVDMGEIARAVFTEVIHINPGRVVRLEQGDLPPALGDSAMIREVLSNLISNAVKFTKPKREAVITLTGTEDGEYNLYCVCDNGVGFDMKHHDKLFEVFRRLHSSAEFEGTGVGLALVQRVVHRHGGRVWAESKVDEGAAFYFTLPAFRL